MKIGVTSFGMVGKPLVEALDLMVDVGAEATELNGRPGVHPGLIWEAGDVTKVKGMLAERGIVATSLGSYNDFAQLDADALEAEIAGLVTYCQRAADLGIPVVRAFGADTREGYTLANFRESIFKGFEEAIRRSEGLGVVIGIENHGLMTNDGDFMREIIDRVDSPRLGVTLDTGNFAWAGHDLATVGRFFDDLLPRIFSLHIKDGVYEEDGFEFVPAGRGVMPLPKLLADLEASEFDAGVISEYEGRATYEDGTRESVAYLRGLRDALASK
jgi:sugar phosphate isomerase/epimerase